MAVWPTVATSSPVRTSKQAAPPTYPSAPSAASAWPTAASAWGAAGTVRPREGQTVRTANYSPTQPADDPFDLSRPGAGQTAFANNGMQYLQPSLSAGLYGSASGLLNSPTNSGGFYGTAQGALNTPSLSSGFYNTALGALNQQSASGGLMGQAQGMLNAPTQAGQAYGQVNGMVSNLPSMGAYSQVAGMLGDQGAVEQYYPEARNLLINSGPSAIEQFYQQAQGTPETKAPTFARDDYARMLDEGKKFANLGSYYDQAITDTTGTLDKAFGARGMFNSSEALKAVGDETARLRAEQANRESDYVLRRLGQENAAAQGASGEGFNEIQQQLARTGLLGQLASNASADRLNRVLGVGNIAGAASQAELGRASTISNSASQASQAQIAAANTIAQMALGIDSNATQRLGVVGNIAANTDSSYNQRLGIAGNAASSADQSYNNRLSIAGNAAANADQAWNSRFSTLGQLALGTDQNRTSALNGYFNAANNAQILGDNRTQNMFQNTNQQTQQIINLLLGGYGGIFGADEQGINNILQSKTAAALQRYNASEAQSGKLLATAGLALGAATGSPVGINALTGAGGGGAATGNPIPGAYGPSSDTWMYRSEY